GGQELGKGGLVLGVEEIVDGAGRQLAERRVGRREDRERTRALQRVDQAGRLHGCNQRGVVLRVHRVLDDVLRRIHRRAADLDGLLGRAERRRCGREAERERGGGSGGRGAGTGGQGGPPR